MDTFGMLLFFLGSLAFWVFLIMFIVRKARGVDTRKSGLISLICIGVSFVGVIIGVAASDTTDEANKNVIEVTDTDLDVTRELPTDGLTVEQSDNSPMVSNEASTDLDLTSISNDTKDALSNAKEEAKTDSYEQPTTKMVAKEKVNVREQPNTDCGILGKLSPGESVSVYENTDDGWSRVDYNGSDGYIKNEYLVSEKDYGSGDDIKSIIPIDSSDQSNAVANNEDSDRSLPESSNTAGDRSNFDTYDIPAQQNTSDTYVLNTKSQKIHYPSCRDVKKISPENYATTNSSVDELMTQGYTTCGHCFN